MAAPAATEADGQTTRQSSEAPTSKSHDDKYSAGNSAPSSSEPSRMGRFPALKRMVEHFQGQPHPAYRELNREKKEIRLLVVKPGAPDEVVSATFKHVSLSRWLNPRYETISYAWGDATQRSTIYLHGQCMSVPASSEAALRRMRLKRRSCVLWIDAICINQDDKHERGHQVGMMADIYGSTRRNLVWLGEEDEYTAAALKSILDLNREFRVETDDMSNAFYTLRNPDLTPKSSSRPIRVKIDPEALEHFYSRPWFSRLWVVQEAALASYSHVFCGRHDITLDYVLRAARWLSYKLKSGHGVSASFFPHCSLLFDYADRGCGLFGPRYRPNAGYANYGLPKSHPGFFHPGMIDLLGNLRDFGAAEPKDHVFALFGLWQRSHPDKELPEILAPDYTSSLSSTLRRATRFAMQETDNLDALKFVQHRIDGIQIPELPTWVPRWHEASDDEFDACPIHSYSEWPRRNEVLRDEEKGSLSMNGAILDDAQLLCRSVTRWKSSAEVLGLGLEIESILSRHLSIDPANHGRILSAFARMGNLELRNLKFKDHETRIFRDWMTVLSGKGEFYKPGKSINPTSEARTPLLFQIGLESISKNRRFFVTSLKYFGFGPQTLRRGDVLAVLDGLRVPAILRPSAIHPGDYEFVGEAAVYGIMRGEAIREAKADGANWGRITLR